MDFRPLVIAALVTLGVAVVLLVAGWLALRKTAASSPWRAAVGPVVLGIAFLAGYRYFFAWPSAWPAEAWEMAVHDAVVLGVMVPLALVASWKVRPPLLLMLVVAVSLLTVREKLSPRGIFFLGLLGTLGAYVVAYRPAVRNPALPLVGPVVLFPPIAGACVVVLPYIDTNLGRMLFLLSVLAGFAIVASGVRAFRSIGRGMSPFLALLFGPLVALSAFYNFPIPNVVFVLLAAAPLAMGVGYLPYLRHRQWGALLVGLSVSLALVIPAVVVAVRNAPALE